MCLIRPFRRLQQYYRQTSREVRRIDSATLSPVYGAFAEVGEAAPCLRAFGLQRTFARRQCILVEAYQRAAISGARVSADQAFLLNGVCAGVAGGRGPFSLPHTRIVPSPRTHARAGVAAGVWLGVRLQLLAALLVTSVAVLAVAACQGLLPGGGEMAASLAGLSLAYALPIVGVLDGLLTYSAETEQVGDVFHGSRVSRLKTSCDSNHANKPSRHCVWQK